MNRAKIETGGPKTEKQTEGRGNGISAGHIDHKKKKKEESPFGLKSIGNKKTKIHGQREGVPKGNSPERLGEKRHQNCKRFLGL